MVTLGNSQVPHMTLNYASVPPSRLCDQERESLGQQKVARMTSFHFRKIVHKQDEIYPLASLLLGHLTQMVKTLYAQTLGCHLNIKNRAKTILPGLLQTD